MLRRLPPEIWSRHIRQRQIHHQNGIQKQFESAGRRPAQPLEASVGRLGHCKPKIVHDFGFAHSGDSLPFFGVDASDHIDRAF